MAKHRSILEELNKISVDKSKDYVVENRAEHVIASAINLLEQIDRNYTPEEAKNLTNQALRYYQGEEQYVMQEEFYGSRYTAGIKFDLFK